MQVKKYLSNEAEINYQTKLNNLKNTNVNMAYRLYLEHIAEKMVFVWLEYNDFENSYIYFKKCIDKNEALLNLLEINRD